MNTDFIEVYDNILSSKECEKIINFVNDQHLKRGTFGGKKYRPDVKDSWEFGVPDINANTLYNRIIEKGLRESVKKYLVRHPQLNDVNPWGPVTGYNLQKYNPKQGYHLRHCENAGNSDRILVWMIYLNTVTDGGGTYFENFDRTTDAVEGRCVLWPPYWTHFHNGIVSNTQTKYIATGWFQAFQQPSGSQLMSISA